MKALQCECVTIAVITYNTSFRCINKKSGMIGERVMSGVPQGVMPTKFGSNIYFFAKFLTKNRVQLSHVPHSYYLTTCILVLKFTKKGDFF